MRTAGGGCDTFDCTRAATRTARWKVDGGTREGRYCDECAERLWHAGDDVDPPFPLADVRPLAGRTLRGG